MLGEIISIGFLLALLTTVAGTRRRPSTQASITPNGEPVMPKRKSALSSVFRRMRQGERQWVFVHGGDLQGKRAKWRSTAYQGLSVYIKNVEKIYSNLTRLFIFLHWIFKTSVKVKNEHPLTGQLFNRNVCFMLSAWCVVMYIGIYTLMVLFLGQENSAWK